MLQNKVVIVTGGAGLIGSEFIKAVVQMGGIGIIADIDAQAGNRTANRLRKDLQRDTIDFIPVDITSSDSIRNLIGSVSSKYGSIDALVNNAYPRNKNYGRKFEEVTYPDFCENVNLHLGGYFLMSQQMAEYFKKQGHGNIINIASIYGIMAPRFEVYEGTAMTMPVEYAVIKSALIHLTRYMAKYYRGCNIRVNSISPGGVHADQPKGFLEKYNAFSLSKGMLDVGDLTGTLLYLLSDASLYINGQNIIVDDGYSL